MLNCPQKLYHKLQWKRCEKKYIFLKVSWDNIDVTDLIAKQVKFNSDIILSVWYFQDKVPSKNNPQNIVWVVLFMQ